MLLAMLLLVVASCQNRGFNESERSPDIPSAESMPDLQPLTLFVRVDLDNSDRFGPGLQATLRDTYEDFGPLAFTWVDPEQDRLDILAHGSTLESGDAFVQRTINLGAEGVIPWRYRTLWYRANFSVRAVSYRLSGRVPVGVELYVDTDGQMKPVEIGTDGHYDMQIPYDRNRPVAFLKQVAGEVIRYGRIHLKRGRIEPITLEEYERERQQAVDTAPYEFQIPNFEFGFLPMGGDPAESNDDEGSAEAEPEAVVEVPQTQPEGAPQTQPSETSRPPAGSEESVDPVVTAGEESADEPTEAGPGSASSDPEPAAEPEEPRQHRSTELMAPARYPNRSRRTADEFDRAMATDPGTTTPTAVQPTQPLPSYSGRRRSVTVDVHFVFDGLTPEDSLAEQIREAVRDIGYQRSYYDPATDQMWFTLRVYSLSQITRIHQEVHNLRTRTDIPIVLESHYLGVEMQIVPLAGSLRGLLRGRIAPGERLELYLRNDKGDLTRTPITANQTGRFEIEIQPQEDPILGIISDQQGEVVRRIEIDPFDGSTSTLSVDEFQFRLARQRAAAAASGDAERSGGDIDPDGQQDSDPDGASAE